MPRPLQTDTANASIESPTPIKKHAFLIGLYFGGFQALMPFLGWALGIRFQKYITSVDHWIAFFLLLFIGGKMVIEAVRDKDVQEIGAKDLPLDHKEMLLLAVATSIDALAVGITFAFLNVSIMEACLISDARHLYYRSSEWLSVIFSAPATKEKQRLQVG